MSEMPPLLDCRNPLEAYLYTLIARCTLCGGGPLQAAPRAAHQGSDGCTVRLACAACGGENELRFALPPDCGFGSWPQSVLQAVGESGEGKLLPDTPRVSRIIDVAGWIALHALAMREMGTQGETSPWSRRQLGLLAGACLDEALAFYDVDNDLPPADAFFDDRSRQAFRDRPQEFARQKLVNLRASLPMTRPAEDSPGSAPVATRPWWMFWRR